MSPRLGSAVRLDRAHPAQLVVPLGSRGLRTVRVSSYLPPVGYQWGMRTVWATKPNGMVVAFCKCGDRVDMPARLVARNRQARCLKCENTRRAGVVFVPRCGPIDVPWDEDIDAQLFVRSRRDRGGTVDEVAAVFDVSPTTVIEAERRALAKLRARYEAGDEEVMALFEAIAMRGGCD